MNQNQKIPDAIGYCRVSTVMQKADGISLETQLKTIEQYCQFKNLNLIKTYTDAGVSGKSMNREQLKLAFSEIKSDNYFIVYDLSRFSRNTLEAIGMVQEFGNRNIHFISIKNDIDLSTPMGRCIFTVLMSFYQLERENLSKTISDNMQRISKEGKLRSRPSFGWKFVGKDRDFLPIPEQMKVIDKIMKLYSEGVNRNRIATILNADGDNSCLNLNKRTNTESFKVFYPDTIKYILKSQGIIVNNTSYRPSDERIISHHKTNTTPPLDQSSSNPQNPQIEETSEPSDPSNISANLVQTPNFILEFVN